jgi:hypothetical protein
MKQVIALLFVTCTLAFAACESKPKTEAAAVDSAAVAVDSAAVIVDSAAVTIDSAAAVVDSAASASVAQ